MSRAADNPSCEQIASLFVFYLCNELSQQEREAVETHATSCEYCRMQLEEERTFSDALAAMPQAADELDGSGAVLSQCRSELAETLDDLHKPAVKEETLRFAWIRRWMIVHPAWSGAALVIFGLAIGTQASQWFAVHRDTGNLEQAVDVRPVTQLTDDQLSRMAVAGINLTPSASSGPQNVRLQLSAEQPMVLTGSPDDPKVRQVLIFVMKNGNRFDSGLRLDCQDALKARSSDLDVRSALVNTARKDPNPAVRLKALEALRDDSSDLAVRAALLDSLEHDANPGVRVEAVNLLVRALEQANDGTVAPLAALPALSDRESVVTVENGDLSAAAGSQSADESMASMIQALEHLQQSDPSQYVRLQSAAALRQIDVRGAVARPAAVGRTHRSSSPQ
jgi:hypothetical protein